MIQLVDMNNKCIHNFPKSTQNTLWMEENVHQFVDGLSSSDDPMIYSVS
jgi:hypothetical protein